jgi:type I restriction enzyme R subunit
VAYKFQTGFDQPLLHTMYVDKKLGGVNAVQTLSRLNRVASRKQETFVLDFANEADEIRKAFEPYYDRALLKEGTDPNILYDLQIRLADFHFYTTDEVNRFAMVYFDPKGTQDRLHAALQSAVDRYLAAGEDERVPFRGQLKDFVGLYAFLSQIMTFADADLEKLYVFGRLLLRKLPVTHERLPVEIQQQIDVESYRVQKTGTDTIKLKRGTVDLEPIKPKDAEMPLVDQIEALSQIIRELNERFGTAFTEEDRIFIEQLEAKLTDNEALEKAVKVNTPENARLTFNHVVNDKLQEMIDTNFKF